MPSPFSSCVLISCLLATCTSLGYDIKRVALITGSNKGIGKEIARKLSASGVHIILGCRDEVLGLKAAAELREEGGTVSFRKLDLNDPGSIHAVRDFISSEFGRLDILVNNAAVCFNDPTLYGKCDYTPFSAQARPTISTNFFGTLDVTKNMLPLLEKSDSARIINIASAAGRLSILRSPEKISKFTSPVLRIEELEALMQSFIVDVENGRHQTNGWPNTCYGASKLGLIALTRVLAREHPGVMVCSVDPGYCATDQNANKGYFKAEWGARTPAWLASLTNDESVEASGKHFFDQKEAAW